MSTINIPISLVVLATGQPAADLSQVCVTVEKISSEPGQDFVSFQVVTPAGVAGSWSVEDTNDEPPMYNGAAWDPFPSDDYSSTPTQPSGGGSPCVTTILSIATCQYKRLKWTPTSGGGGTLPTSIRVTKGAR